MILRKSLAGERQEFSETLREELTGETSKMESPKSMWCNSFVGQFF
jgi:hypothetical protein